MTYRIVRTLSRFLFAILFRLKSYGQEAIPSEGPALIVSNHSSYLDPLAILCTTSRPIRWIVMQPVYDVPVLGWILKHGECIRVNGALDKAADALRRGELVGIFPEGGRSRDGTVGEGASGAVRLALLANAPILPTAVVGSFKAWGVGRFLPRPSPIRVIFGQPIQPGEFQKDPSSATTPDLEALTQRLMSTIRNLWKENTLP